MQDGIAEYKISKMKFVYEERTFVGRNQHFHHGNGAANAESVTFPWHLRFDCEYTHEGEQEKCECICGEKVVGIIDITTLVSWGCKATVAHEVVGSTSPWSTPMRLACVVSTIFTGASTDRKTKGHLVPLFRKMWSSVSEESTVFTVLSPTIIQIDTTQRNPWQAICKVRSADFRPQPMRRQAAAAEAAGGRVFTPLPTSLV